MAAGHRASPGHAERPGDVRLPRGRPRVALGPRVPDPHEDTPATRPRQAVRQPVRESRRLVEAAGSALPCVHGNRNHQRPSRPAAQLRAPEAKHLTDQQQPRRTVITELEAPHERPARPRVGERTATERQPAERAMVGEAARRARYQRLSAPPAPAGSEADESDPAVPAQPSGGCAAPGTRRLHQPVEDREAELSPESPHRHASSPFHTSGWAAGRRTLRARARTPASPAGGMPPAERHITGRAAPGCRRGACARGPRGT